eukprot:364150-Chlamydomonas_euryale.AAC.6
MRIRREPCSASPARRGASPPTGAAARCVAAHRQRALNVSTASAAAPRPAQDASPLAVPCLFFARPPVCGVAALPAARAAATQQGNAGMVRTRSAPLLLLVPLLLLAASQPACPALLSGRSDGSGDGDGGDMPSLLRRAAGADIRRQLGTKARRCFTHPHTPSKPTLPSPAQVQSGGGGASHPAVLVLSRQPDHSAYKLTHPCITAST